MVTNHAHILTVHSNYKQQRLLEEANRLRLYQQWRQAKRHGAQGINDNQCNAPTMVTWRRLWQHLLVGSGLLAALLIRL